VALGGDDDPANLVAACRDCNSGKASTQPGDQLVADVSADAMRWARAMERAAEEAVARDKEVAEYSQAFDKAWLSWHYGSKELEVPRPDDWSASINRFRLAGMPLEMLLESMRRAMRAQHVSPENTFRYMCGIVYNNLRELQERARQILAESEPAEVDHVLDAVLAWQRVDESRVAG